MSKPLKTLTAAALAVTLAWPVAAQDTPDAETVVATVDGTEITLGHMILIYAGLPDQYKQLPPPTLWEGILEQVIQQTALSQIDDLTETKRVRLAMDNERRALMSSEAIAKLMADPLSEADLQAAYDAKYGAFEGETEFNASHILLETEEDAKAVIADLEGGADFATVAREKSTGPSGPSGGSLGWFGPGMMVPPFQAAVEAMEAGAISVPVQTQFGWHVIRLNETRNSSAPGFDEVRADLEAELAQSKASDYIEQITNAATVTRVDAGTIDPSLLSQLELLDE